MRPFFDEATRLYWLIKGRTDQGIPEKPEVGQTFSLEKRALFRYPLGQILPVCHDDFAALAYARVLSCEQQDGLTRVDCQIVTVLTEQEKRHLSAHLQVDCQIVTVLTEQEKRHLSAHLQTVKELSER